MSAHAEPEVHPNYRYWQDHGAGWAEEYDRRKESVPLYHVQELMLADYMERSAPVRVLEYGCGVGRHLSYLRELPGVEVHGYDQSPTMVAEMATWAAPDWIAERVRVGGPVGRLPYPDRHFDVVFTAEVLVHVRPEDIDPILTELLRVASWQVLHVEPPADYPVDRETHGGCWAHDLPAAYRRLGRRCELLPAGYSAHTPCRVLLETSRPPYTWSPVALRLFRRLERDVGRGLAMREEQARAAAAEVQQLQGLGAELIEERRQAAQRTEELARMERELRQTQDILAETRRLRRLDAVRLDDLERRLRRLAVVEQAFVRGLDAALDRRS
jgi:SAM-dependent methyltransferase